MQDTMETRKEYVMRLAGARMRDLRKPAENAPVWEKIRWLNVNVAELSDLKTRCVDKISAKGCAVELSDGMLSVARTIAVIHNASEIRTVTHPSRFFVKKNAGCRTNVFVEDRSKLDVAWLQKKMDSWDCRYPGINSDEFQYALVEPRIFSEESLLGFGEQSLLDYRFWVFSGKCAFLAVNGGRGFGGQYFFDTAFSHMDLYNLAHPVKTAARNVQGGQDRLFQKPKNFDVMVKCAEMLGRPFPFVRVDLYNIGGIPYFGEFTFSPGGYFTRFVNSSGASLDEEIGKWLQI